MDLYHVFCNLKNGVSDLGFCDDVSRYLGALRDGGRIRGFRLTRRKLGLGPESLGEFHIQIEVDDLAQLDRAFQAVSERSGPIEELHARVNQVATDLRFALYRDFPDPQRRRGEERF
jgi:Family of unknown function (DUF6614)